jgi:hypothetical protein
MMLESKIISRKFIYQSVNGIGEIKSLKTHPMKSILIFFLAAFTFTLNTQSGTYNGKYELKLEADNGDFHDYKLNLNSDGTFVFRSNSHISKRITPKNNTYGKGTWKAEKNIISFTTDKVKDLDITHSLDFSNSKARYDSKSPRDKSDRVVPSKLKFYQSDIFWIKGIELLKSK